MNNNVLQTSKIKKLHIIILVFAIVIVLASIRWQGIEAARLTQIAKEQSSTEEINAVRGTIYAKDGTTLAYTEPRFNIFIWTPDLYYYEKLHLQTRQEFVNKVAPILDMTPEALAAKISPFDQNQTPAWIPVAKGLNDSQWTQLTSLTSDNPFHSQLKGYHKEDDAKRIYPEKRLASQVLGLTNVVNNKIVGVGGLEGEWNNILNPIKGILIQQTNAKGEAISTALTATVEPKNGSSVYTTIDKKLQEIVEQKIKEGVEKYKATSGSVVIMDPKTGEIMALANYPDYDPNLREETDSNVYGDLAISSPYEMGSIGKALTISAAIDQHKVTPDTIILPHGHQGCEKISDELLPVCTADKKPQPPMPLKDCFANSDNLCLYHLTKDFLGKENLYNYLSKFGIGESTGVDLTGESYGPLRPLDEWTIGDVAAMSYGHGYSVNLVQAASAIATIANNGVRMKPHIVDKVVDSDGNVNDYKPEVVDTVMTPDTAKTLMYMMNYNMSKAVAAGEYWYYGIRDHYRLGVKSGTALIATQTGYSEEINASFVGFDESDKRSFIMLIKLQKPEYPATKLSFYNVRPLWFDTFLAVKDVIGVPRF